MTYKKLLWPLLGIGIGTALLSQCIFSDPPPGTYFLSLKVPETFTKMNTVKVSVLSLNLQDTIEVVWTDSLTSTDQLMHLPTKKYRGEEAFVIVQGFREDGYGSSIRAHFYPNNKPPEIIRTYTIAMPLSEIFTAMDSIHVSILSSDLKDTLEIISKDSLVLVNQSLHFPTQKYQGGEAIIIVDGYRSDLFAAKIMSHFYATGIAPVTSDAYSLSLKVPESFAQMDSVFVSVLSADLKDTIEVLWKDSLDSTSRLLQLPAPKYKGQKAYISASSFYKGLEQYRVTSYYGAFKDVQHFLTASKDAGIDTSRTDERNQGLTAISELAATTSTKVFCIAFDWSTLDQGAITKANIQLHSHAFPGAWTSSEVPLTVTLYAMKYAWAEGTGNWYWNKGKGQNGGDTILQNYPRSEYVNSKSTPPEIVTGINPMLKSLVRRVNLDSVSFQNISARYLSIPNGNIYPPPKELTILDIDVTSFIKNTTSSNAFGFIIKVDGAKNPNLLGVASKELGNGTFGPKLRVTF